MTEPQDPPAPKSRPAPTALTEEAQSTWAARFGWLTGGTLGLVLGFFATWAIERWFLMGRVEDPTRFAATLSSGLVPGLFIAGALVGHGFGLKGGARRYRFLGAAAGIVLAGAAWLGLVFTR